MKGILGLAQVRQELTVIGDTVNLAARLQSVAENLPEGGLVIDEGIASLVSREQLAEPPYEELAVKSVKGKQREVRIYRWR